MDRVNPEKRSEIMSHIRGKNTKPELLVRSLLHRAGFRFRLHRKDLPGKPDIVLPKYKTAIFVHGCFWHQHSGCKHSHCPKSNIPYWQAKLEKNVIRHQQHEAKLAAMGWKVAVIWECEVDCFLQDPSLLHQRLQIPQ